MKHNGDCGLVYQALDQWNTQSTNFAKYNLSSLLHCFIEIVYHESSLEISSTVTTSYVLSTRWD
jgi:hypothetical protein